MTEDNVIILTNRQSAIELRLVERNTSLSSLTFYKMYSFNITKYPFALLVSKFIAQSCINLNIFLCKS